MPPSASVAVACGSSLTAPPGPHRPLSPRLPSRRVRQQPPVILPFSAFSLITLSAASSLGDASLTPFTLMTATYYPVALFVVFTLSIVTGIGRPKAEP
ncbi:MAG: hypothetical protein V8T46_08515 [Sutterella seckii]